jgi:hypothetical protein
MVSREECTRRFLEAVGFAQAVLHKERFNTDFSLYTIKDPTNACEWFQVAEYWYRLT